MTLILRQAMTSSRHLTFYHSPQTRSTGVLTLLIELKADYELRLLFQKKEEQRSPDYLAVNPMGKVPALVHDGVLITEQVAIYLYLADLYPEADLAPACVVPTCAGWRSTGLVLNLPWWTWP
jgi:glutathione S-transferase